MYSVTGKAFIISFDKVSNTSHISDKLIPMKEKSKNFNPRPHYM
jgi:hypothetical protein